MPKDRLYLYCPECAKQSQVLHERGADLKVHCGDCLMERVEVVEMIAGRVHPVGEEE